MSRGPALGGARGGLGFEADAQFQHGENVVHGGNALGLDAKVKPGRRIPNESADAVPRLHETRRLKSGNSLADHGPADAVLQHDLRFGGQLGARPECVGPDLNGKRVRNFLGEPEPARFSTFDRRLRRTHTRHDNVVVQRPTSREARQEIARITNTT